MPDLAAERPASDDLLTTEETAAILRLDPNTLYQWTWAKRGPRSIKVGGRRRYRRSDLDSWLEQQGER